MSDQLSGVAIIICIAFGILTFFLLFIFANRQIKRFSLKSRSGPYAPIAIGAPKSMQLETDRRLDAVKSISYHPKLLKKHEEQFFLDGGEENPEFLPSHMYRMRALDSLRTLHSYILALDHSIGCLFNKDLRLCLIRLYQKGRMRRIELSVVHRFIDACDLARHEPAEFGPENFLQFLEYFSQVKQSISRDNETQQITNNKHPVPPAHSPSIEEKHLSNGNLSPALSRTSPDGESSDDKKVAYETLV